MTVRKFHLALDVISGEPQHRLWATQDSFWMRLWHQMWTEVWSLVSQMLCLRLCFLQTLLCVATIKTRIIPGLLLKEDIWCQLWFCIHTDRQTDTHSYTHLNICTFTHIWEYIHACTCSIHTKWKEMKEWKKPCEIGFNQVETEHRIQIKQLNRD